MKKITYIAMLAAAIVATATSCNKEELVLDERIAGDDSYATSGLVFRATLENTDTKTTFSKEESAGYKILWEATDSISVNGVIYKAIPDKGDAAIATFIKMREADPDPVAPFKAYYPASVYDSTAKAATLPETQVYATEGSVAGVLPMYAESKDVKLSFMNLCGLMKFTLKGTETVQSITLTDGTKALSGKFDVKGNAAVLDGKAKGGVTLDCGEGVQLDETTGKTFYVAVPAGSYDRLKIVYIPKDILKICEMKANATATVERSKVYAFNQTPAFRPDWFYFETVEAGAKVALVKPSKAKNPPKEPSLLYSTDGGTSWNNYTIADTIQIGDGQTAGQKIFFKAATTNTSFGAVGPYDYYYFTTTDSVEVGGNIMYLLNGSDPTAATVSSYCFKGLFKENSFIVSASDLKLPAAKLSDNCYRFMFMSCKSLKTAPALPATELADTCYYQMFTTCHALKAAPALPATTLKTLCYDAMFQGCTTLVAAPALPASEMAISCYNQMFNNCYALVTAPALPATTLATKCYFKMFCDCIALENPPALPATELADNCYDQMFTSCSTLVAAPPLPAEVLKPGCYNLIFSKCVKLSSVTMLATDVSAKDCLNNWLGYGAGSDGSVTSWTVNVADGMVDAVKATVPDKPDWKSGVREKGYTNTSEFEDGGAISGKWK